LAWLLRSRTLDEDLRRLIFETTLESSARRIGVDQATYAHALTVIAPKTATRKRTRTPSTVQQHTKSIRTDPKHVAGEPMRTTPDHSLYFPHLTPKESSDAKRR